MLDLMFNTMLYLEYDIGQHYNKRVGQVKQQPDLHWLDIRGGGQAGGDWEVDRGQDHHAGDVGGVDHAVLVGTPDVVGGLVDHVHQDGG